MAISTIQNASLASGVPASSNMPVGSVLQVIQATTQTPVSTTSASFVTTNLTASITPKFSTSKILVCVNMLGFTSASAGQCVVTVFRGTVSGTDLGGTTGNGFGSAFSGAGETMSVISGMVLDSPATTSATTYTVGFKRKSAGTSYVMVDDQKASITLMEIAA
jgi:hypothetical protein